MGTSRTAAEMAGKIHRAAAAIDKARKDQLTDAGKDLESAFDRSVRSDLGGDNRFSGWPKAPLVSKARLDGLSGLTFAPQGKSKGPTRVAESGRHPGMYGPQQGPALGGFTKKGRARKTRGKKWNGSTRGKGTWSDAINDASNTIPDKLRTGFIKAATEVFR